MTSYWHRKEQGTAWIRCQKKFVLGCVIPRASRCSERQDSRKSFPKIYRVTMVVVDMGWVDYEFGHSTACQVLPRHIGVWQNAWLGGQDGRTYRPPLSHCTQLSTWMWLWLRVWQGWSWFNDAIVKHKSQEFTFSGQNKIDLSDQTSQPDSDEWLSPHHWTIRMATRKRSHFDCKTAKYE